MAFDPDRVRALCFDLDGTLSDTDDLWIDHFEKIFHPAAVLFPERNLRPFARRLIMAAESPGNALYHLLDRFDLDDDAARFYNWLIRMRRKQIRKSYWIIPHASDTLKNLSIRFPMSVVSAGSQAGIDGFLEYFSLNPLFTAVATSQTCRYTKPFPDPVLWAARQMDVSPEACLMVGDTTVDIRAGKSAGAQTVGVLTGFGTADELRRAGADLILSGIWELVDILSGPDHKPWQD